MKVTSNPTSILPYVYIGGSLIAAIVIIIILSKVFKGFGSLFKVGGLFESQQDVSELKMKDLDGNLISKATITDKKALEVAEDFHTRLDSYLNDTDLIVIHRVITNTKIPLANIAKIMKFYGIREKYDLYNKIKDYTLFTDENQKMQREILKRLSQTFKK